MYTPVGSDAEVLACNMLFNPINCTLVPLLRSKTSFGSTFKSCFLRKQYITAIIPSPVPKAIGSFT